MLTTAGVGKSRFGVFLHKSVPYNHVCSLRSGMVGIFISREPQTLWNRVSSLPESQSGKHSSEHTDRTQTGSRHLDLPPSAGPHQLLNLNPGFLSWRSPYVWQQYKIWVLCTAHVSSWKAQEALGFRAKTTVSYELQSFSHSSLLSWKHSGLITENKDF